MKGNWTLDYQLKYYMEDRKGKYINEKIDKVLLEVYKKISKKGINRVLKPKVLKKIYNKYVNIKKTK